MTFIPKLKDPGKPTKMVLDGQQRLQALYVGICGSRDGKRLYFNITSGLGFRDEESDESELPIGSFRFEFWQDGDQLNRPRRLIRVSEIVEWPARFVEDEIEKLILAIGLEGDEARLAAKNLRLLRQVVSQADVVPVSTIDEEVRDAGQARPLSEILDIFVRVNSGGTRLTRSDLMFSLIKTKSDRARQNFDELVANVDPKGNLGIDKDFVIRGLLLVADAPTSFEVAAIDRHWGAMESEFDNFSAALRSAIEFCREPWVGLTSASLIEPIATLYPVIYFLSRQKNGNVPDDQRNVMRTICRFPRRFDPGFPLRTDPA